MSVLANYQPMNCCHVNTVRGLFILRYPGIEKLPLKRAELRWIGYGSSHADPTRWTAAKRGSAAHYTATLFPTLTADATFWQMLATFYRHCAAGTLSLSCAVGIATSPDPNNQPRDVQDFAEQLGIPAVLAQQRLGLTYPYQTPY